MRAVISDHIEQPVEDQGDLLIIAFGLDVSDGCFSARIMVCFSPLSNTNKTGNADVSSSVMGTIHSSAFRDRVCPTDN